MKLNVDFWHLFCCLRYETFYELNNHRTLKIKIMKRKKLNSKNCASMFHLPKFTIVLALMLAFGLSVSLNADAQRRGGSGGGSRGGSSHFMGSVGGPDRSAGSHFGSGYSRVYGGRSFSGNYGHRGFPGRGYYGYRGLPYWRYGYLPFWGDFFWGIPPYSCWFYLNGYNYYNCDGVYYKKENDKYQVVPAPVGSVVKELPKNSIQFTLDGAPYYYYFGTYYIPLNGQFEIVEPPIGAEVDSIPDGYDKVMIDGQTYYSFNGVQYKAVLRDKVIWYQVIKNNTTNPDTSTPSSNRQPDLDNESEHN